MDQLGFVIIDLQCVHRALLSSSLHALQMMTEPLRGEVKTMLSDDLGGKKNCRKRPAFWQVGLVSSEKPCSEVFFAGLLFGFENGRMQKGQTGWKSSVFFACAISRKQSRKK